MFALGMGMIFSSLTTKYKDLSFLLTFGVQLFMYLTPVVYPISALPEKFRFLVYMNPLSSIFQCFRYAFLGSGSFDLLNLVWSGVFITFILIIGTVIFNKVEKSFMDTVWWVKADLMICWFENVLIWKIDSATISGRDYCVAWICLIMFEMVSCCLKLCTLLRGGRHDDEAIPKV